MNKPKKPVGVFQHRLRAKSQNVAPEYHEHYNNHSKEMKRNAGGFLPAKYRRRRRDLDLMGDARGDMHELVRRAVDAVRCGAGETAAALMRSAGRAVVDGGTE